ncbi:hypothetical protein MUP32_05615 [Candidatus Microgenomates bacterium]|nr:hypothetical protein [Candidatus Microgenomates bacterium]
MKTSGKKIHGYSIIEVIIYIGMLSVFITVLTGIFVSTIDAKLESESISDIEQDGRFIVAKLAYEINRAQNIETPALGITGNTLQITVDSLAESFALANGKLHITKSDNTYDLNGHGTAISNLTFQRLGNINGKNSIKMTFIITSTTQRVTGPETKTFQTTLAIR